MKYSLYSYHHLLPRLLSCPPTSFSCFHSCFCQSFPNFGISNLVKTEIGDTVSQDFFPEVLYLAYKAWHDLTPAHFSNPTFWLSPLALCFSHDSLSVLDSSLWPFRSWFFSQHFHDLLSWHMSSPAPGMFFPPPFIWLIPIHLASSRSQFKCHFHWKALL